LPTKKGLNIHQQLPSGKHTNNSRKPPCLVGKSAISMAIFNSYVELPEAISLVDSPNYGVKSRITSSTNPNNEYIPSFHA
jgi:hypothetical protein